MQRVTTLESSSRAVVAALIGIAAALLPWQEPVAPTITLLAPRGRVDAVPTRVCWRATVSAPRIRLLLRDAVGNLVSARTEAALPEVRSLALLPAEQEWLAAAGRATIELVAMGPDGEWRGRSLPARLTLSGHPTINVEGLGPGIGREAGGD